jgi:amino-acid N-acetyltransferase
MNLAPAQAGDCTQVKQLLAACELPYQDLTPAHLQHFWTLRDGATLAGVVGIELYRNVGLLRSLAVQESLRSKGIGSQLVHKAEEYARLQGVEELYLLTTTRYDYFAKRGYETTNRSSAPGAIQETTEFKSLCPESAVCMVKRLS